MAGQIPLAYVVRAANSGLTQDQVIQFVSSQVRVRNSTIFHDLIIYYFDTLLFIISF